MGRSALADGLKHALPVLLVLLPISLAWRAWLASDRTLVAVWQRKMFLTALCVTTADVALTSGLWFYFWATPFSADEIIRSALLFGVPVSCVAVALLAVGHGKGWRLATTSPAIALAGWVIACCSLSR
jgi:hypothetical protein